MIASPGSPTTSLIEFSVSNRRVCCPDLWQSLWGCHRVQFLDRLFSVYIKEVALAAGESLIHLYADDTILYTSGPSLDTVLTTHQASFNAIQLSFRGLQLLLNTSKTKCMLFNRSLPAPARLSNITTLDGSDLEYVDNYKYLGVWLDCKLSFQTHIKHLQSKVKSRIDFLFRNKASFTHAAKHTLVKLTILPILDFGDVIYKIAIQSPIYYPPLQPVPSCWLALASYSSPNPLAPGHLQDPAR
ncbi:unnamed protein product [Oncorhynchus mykiss]|uniref:Uncharacterized protein n=1 Tax=Oncorhynchus mykiss TaxID=8022 RepID=A0A060W7R8_ONCMY|nr:unnamed protein product [Oncorhynchus mykiss]